MFFSIIDFIEKLTEDRASFKPSENNGLSEELLGEAETIIANQTDVLKFFYVRIHEVYEQAIDTCFKVWLAYFRDFICTL